MQFENVSMPSPKNIIHFLVISIFALVFVGIYQWVHAFDGKLHVVFCNVGQGDGIYIRTPGGADILVDAGPGSVILSCLESHMPFWDRKIELVVLTNADADHYLGLIDVVRRYAVEKFTVSQVGKSDASFEALEREVEKQGIRTISTAAGDRFRVGRVVFDTLWPDKTYLVHGSLRKDDPKNINRVLGAFTAQKSVNEFSVVQLLTYKTFNVLLTGDIVPPAIERLYTIPFDSVEVLKVPHHGSRNGLTEALLNKVSPQVAIISSGKNNRYGHPHQETLEMLRQKGVRVLRTDQQGEIEIVSDGKSWKVVR